MIGGLNLKKETSHILVVDLDHTLIDTDLLFESSKGVLIHNPLLIFIYPLWFIKGKGFLKDQLKKRFEIDPKSLPYRQVILDYIHQRKSLGHRVILATASHKYYANKVATHLGIFDEVLASDRSFNLSSHNKASVLIKKYGSGNFDYIGDHMRDMPVWDASHLSIITNASKRVIKKTSQLNRLILD
jgi:phosphoserine phosphatase